MDHSERLEGFLKAAAIHGDTSDPEHETGDLIDALRAAVDLMEPDQRDAFFQLDEIKGVIESYG